jgi:FG-GAP repeat
MTPRRLLAHCSTLLVAVACPSVASAAAGGDFDGDGRSDLAVGAPSDSVSGHDGAGAVNVLAVNVVYGSERHGLSFKDDFFSQDSSGVNGHSEAFDNFAITLGTGDFDGDRHADLVAGAPYDSVAGFPDAGAVNVLHGGRHRVVSDRDDLWTQGTAGIKGAVGDDSFGRALAAGPPAR